MPGRARCRSRACTSPEDVAKAYSAVTVSGRDVSRVALEVLDLDHAVTAVLTPRREGAHGPPPAAGFGGAESFASPCGTMPCTPLPDWAASALASCSLPPHGGDARRYSVLPNGLRLIVQPETRQPHDLRLSATSARWPTVQEPPGKEGVSAADVRAVRTMARRRRDRLAFRKAIDDIAATG